MCRWTYRVNPWSKRQNYPSVLECVRSLIEKLYYIARVRPRSTAIMLSTYFRKTNRLKTFKTPFQRLNIMVQMYSYNTLYVIITSKNVPTAGKLSFTTQCLIIAITCYKIMVSQIEIYVMIPVERPP